MDLSPGYREYAAPGLACVWVGHNPRSRNRPTRVLPDACVDVIWFAGQGAIVAGPDTTAHLAATAPGDLLIGARFAPGTGAAALGLPLHALRDQRVPLGDVRPDLAALLSGDLMPAAALGVLRSAWEAGAPTPHSAASRAARPTGERRAPAAWTGPPDRTVHAVVTALRDPRRRVTALANEIGLSDRQLRRRCEAAVGYGPKQLQRVLRLQGFLAAAESQDPANDLMRLALDAGYSDQSHLTTDCTRLTGLPPAALLRERTAGP